MNEELLCEDGNVEHWDLLLLCTWGTVWVIDHLQQHNSNSTIFSQGGRMCTVLHCEFIHLLIYIPAQYCCTMKDCPWLFKLPVLCNISIQQITIMIYLHQVLWQQHSLHLLLKHQHSILTNGIPKYIRAFIRAYILGRVLYYNTLVHSKWLIRFGKIVRH